MNWDQFFKALPPIGWVAIFSLIILLFVMLYFVYILLNGKDIKTRHIQLTDKNTRELYQTEGKNLLDNQCNTAHNLIKKIWIDIYESAKSKFSITDRKDLWILEDIAHLIEGKLNYEIKNDLTRNHITEKSDLELTRYSEAKALGYYRLVLAMLYDYNSQLPEYYLPEALSTISVEEFKKIFSEIYFSSRKIAGGGE